MSQPESQSHQLSCLKYDEFLVENIYSQLVNFHTTKHFIIQSYLVRIFLFFNKENMQFPEMFLTAEVNNNIFNYMNLIMEEIYRVMFQNKLPKVLPEMQEILQFALDRRMGDWFLLKEHIITRVYGFFHEPYILLAFLTPRIFSLEFIRQKLIV